MKNEAAVIAKLTRAEKLRLMEALWQDMADNTEPPAWHAEELARREEDLRTGKDFFSDWNVAKKRLRKKLL